MSEIHYANKLKEIIANTIDPMFATFTIVGSVCLPKFARKMEIMLPSKFASVVYDLYFNPEWYKMGDIPGFEPYRGITEDDMNPNNLFQRYSWVWKNPFIVENIIIEDITKVITLIERLRSEETVYHILIDKTNLPPLGQLFVAVKKMENGLVNEGLAAMEKLMCNQAYEPHIKTYLKRTME